MAFLLDQVIQTSSVPDIMNEKASRISSGVTFRRTAPILRDERMAPRQKNIEKSSRVVAHTDMGPIIEIAFRGTAWDGCGNNLFDYAGGVVQDLRPAGVLLNLTDYKTKSWDDIGPVVGQFFDRQTRTPLPFCFVARGKTAKSMKTMIMAMQFSEITEVFADEGEGLGYLKKKIHENRNDPNSSITESQRRRTTAVGSDRQGERPIVEPTNEELVRSSVLRPWEEFFFNGSCLVSFLLSLAVSGLTWWIISLTPFKPLKWLSVLVAIVAIAFAACAILLFVDIPILGRMLQPFHLSP
jgi:hypothetical protein